MATNKIFLDTNVLLDFLLSREGELKEVEEILDLANIGIFECYISESVISTCIFVLEKDKRATLEMLRELSVILKAIPFNLNILKLPLEEFKDLEDGLLFFLAQEAEMDFFITRNKKDFKNAPISLPVLTPTEFINHLQFNDLQK